MKNLKTESKWAFLFILISLLWMLLEKLSGLHGRYIDYHLYLTNLFAIPAIWMYVLALKDKKNNFYNGRMSYKEGVVSGLIITLIVAIASPITQWIITYVISPEYFPNVIKRSVEIGYYASTAEAEANFNYSNYAVQSVIGALVMGLLTTIIVMIFLRSKTQKQ
jgi:hypothetical protein